jgi:hypothetical protein
VAQNTQEQLSLARAQVVRASELLLSPTPQTLDACALLLRKATQIVSACYSDLTGPMGRPAGHSGAALAEARQLKKDIGRARLLLDAALKFHLEWRRRLAALSFGYTPGGEPAAGDPGVRLVLRG